MYFVFDTETSGLPSKRNAKYTDHDAYSSCRVVSIAWTILNAEFVVESEVYFVIKPKGFVIPDEAIAIHGITNEVAIATGYEFEAIAHVLEADLKRCNTLVAHNLFFDFGVVLHELHLIGRSDLVDAFFNMARCCTMFMGKQHLKVSKFPKLAELYSALFNGASFENAHNALGDTKACADCFCVMKQQLELDEMAQNAVAKVLKDNCTGEA